MEFDIRECLAKVQESQDFEALQSAYSMIKHTSAEANGPRIPPELYVICAENALQMEHMQMCFECLNMYFEGDPPHDQFFCRALMCQGQLMSLFVSPAKSVKDIKEATTDFLKAIEMAKSDPSTHFLVFNTSVLYFQGVRPLLQPGLCHHLVPSLKQVVKSLEEVADLDHSWRAELMIQLVKCILDSGELEDAARYAKVTEVFIKLHTPYLYPGFYTLQVQEKLLQDKELHEISRQCTSLKVIYEIQQFKTGWKEQNEKTLTEEDSVKLREIFSLLVDSAKVSAAPAHLGSEQIPTPIQPCDRVTFLLELALLSLQVKDQEVAADCWEQLKLAEEVNIDQRIMMECVNCEINLLKKGAKMNDYSKTSVEARLKEIEKLDQWLEAAVKEGRPQAAQALCASQWHLCLPLLQHNLRKCIKMPLLKLALVLEYTQSMSLEMRCEVHSELAAIEEEEGDLKATLNHLEKALLLDSGTYRERLLSALHLLQLRRTPYQTPACPLDKAAKIMQQVRDIPPHQSTDRRPLLVSVGLLLAPFDFQTALDADHHTKFFAGSLGPDPLAVLAAKAQHHSTYVEKVNDYLDRESDETDNTVRVKLWITLAKTARKLEVWDVCRAACRFCLLYDDGAEKSSEKSKSPRRGSSSQSFSGTLKSVELLHLLAEICFINAEATIQQLLEEGVHLNSPAVPPKGEKVHVAEDDQRWILYRDWIQSLSAYATRCFLRGGEIGVEIGEHCLVENAAIYLWNYNTHMLAAEEYKLLLPTFQHLVEMLLRMKDISNLTMCVMVCNAVTRGLMIQPACDSVRSSAKGKYTATKHGTLLDAGGSKDLKKALELCECALRISSGDRTMETVPIAVRKLALTSWVQIKQLLHQQIGVKLDIFKDKSENKEVAEMSRVLVGLEMLNCNRNPKHMDFSVPSLSTLAGMASECSWADAVVELQVWCQLAAFCHSTEDHSLVLCCTQKALELETAAADSLTTMPCLLYEETAVNKMLSSAACLRGLSLVCTSSGNLDKYREALKVILSGVSFAEKTGSQELCVTAAGHFWNACLPLTQSPRDKWWLQEHLEKILNILLHIRKSASKSKRKSWSMQEMPQGIPSDGLTRDTKELCLRAKIIRLLVSIYVDKEDFTRSLKLLDKTISEMTPSKHRLILFKTRILLKARLGECIEIDMEMLHEEGEQCCSAMWHQAALCGVTLKQQLTCYQKAIRRLTSKEFEWQKVNLLLEFGGWMYSHNFPKSDAQLQVQWAIDILLHLEPKQEVEPDESVIKTEQSKSLIGVHGQFTQNLSNLKEVRTLDQLTQAHTLLAIMADRTSAEHQQNLLQAYTLVLQIWQVSLATASEILKEMMKNEPIPSPTVAPKKGKGKDKGKDKEKDKGKDKDKDKGKDKEKDKGKSKDKDKYKDKDKELVSTEDEETLTMVESVPSTLKEWAQYVCPEPIRQIFKATDSPHCINKYSFLNQNLSLFYLRRLERELCSLSLDHLTLPVLHLAEIISLDLLQRRGLSDLYRLRIANTCVELGFGFHSPYQEMLQSLSKIQVNEQMKCRKEVSLSELRRLGTVYNQKAEVDEHICSGKLGADVSSHDIWLEKAEVCLSLGLYQSARQLLGEAHKVARELGDERAEAKSLVSLAALACEEQNFAQAQILLDKVQTPKGEHDFWYHFTLTRVTAVVGLRDEPSQTKVDQIVKQGCEALQLIAGLQENRVQELRSAISSLENRGAVECVRAISNATTAETSDTEVVERLVAACETLRLSADGLTKLNFGQQAAEAHRNCAYGLRILAGKVTDVERKHRYLLDALSQMQLAVAQQEHVTLSAQRLFSPQESCNLSQKSTRKLVGLRVYMTELCMEILEENCAKQTQEVFARLKKTTIEIILEDFTRNSPEPGSTEMDWECTDRTLGQTILSQLAALNFQTSDNMEIRARCLNMHGRYLKVLAMQREPMYVKALWHKHMQDASPDSNIVPTAEEHSGKRSDSRGKESGSTSDRGAEQQQWKDEAQELLAEASKVLSESTRLCLQHNLPSAILAEASFHMLDCNGQSDPTETGQYLALFQSCCTVAMAAELLSCACADTSVSQLSALLSLHRNLFVSQEKRSSSMLKRSEEQLLHLFKAFHQLTIIPNHLDILSDIPPSMNILLLQHSNDGSELFGGFYATTKAPEHPKAKISPPTGVVPCSQVAKVSVCPQALGALREQTRVFGLESKHSVLKDESSQLETSKVHQDTTRDRELQLHFGEIVEKMEDYLNPLLSQFDFPFIRSQTISPPISENELKHVKEEKCSLVDNGEHLVVLADRKLLELPLEALPLLHGEGLASVSRDFSLQLFFSRLSREQILKVESDSKKETKTKGGKGAKKKEAQKKGVKSKAIKAPPANPVLPSYTFTMDTTNLKYIVDPYKEGQSERASLTSTMKEVLEHHKHHLPQLWKNFFSRSSLFEIEQVLCKCSAFIYMGMDPLLESIPPAKVAAFNLTECRMALLFDRIESKVKVLPSINESQKSAELLTLENPLETALLLSLTGVGCVVLNQWHNTLKQKAQDLTAVLDSMLRVKETSGHAIHALKGREHTDMPQQQVTETYDTVHSTLNLNQDLTTDSKENEVQHLSSLTPAAYNCILYGLPNYIVP